MNTQNDLILISKHTLKAFTSVLRVFFMWLSFRSAGSDGSEGLFRSSEEHSSRGQLCDPVFHFILPDTAVKGVCRQAHSPHKIPACDVLRLPFPIELPEPRPVGGDRFPSRVLALSLSDLDALTLSLFELLTL